MANAIDSLNFNSTDYVFTLPYGTCSTAAATAAKVVTLDNFSLETGASVRIKFTYANSVSSPTLNINGTGAKSIYWHGATLASSQYWQAGAVLDFVYNGTQWDMIGVAKDNNTTYSAAGSSLGLVKSGGDVTISSGTITVNDDSHNHVIENVDGLQDALDGKVDLTSSQTITGFKTFANGLSTRVWRNYSTESDYQDIRHPGKSGVIALTEDVLDRYGGYIGKDGGGTNSEIFNDYNTNSAEGDYSHAEGRSTTASGWASHAEGYATLAKGSTAHAEGSYAEATGDNAHAEGYYTEAQGTNSHAEGYYSLAIGASSHAEGGSGEASGDYSHVEGFGGEALGDYSHAEGNNTKASGEGSHAEGVDTIASGKAAHAEGYGCKAQSLYVHAEGVGTIAQVRNIHVQGHYNSNPTASSAAGTYGTAFVIGNGTNDSSRSNAFRVSYAGEPYSLSSLNTSGADYAEFFEWLDSNPDSEDRRGYFVTLDGDKIKIAEPGDYILGIISALPAVIGNGDEDWKGKYILDDFGAFITEEFEYDMEEPVEIVDEETGETKIETQIVKKTGTKYKENPDYDPSVPYIQREDRPEWDTVGMMGVLAVRDDGTCKVNGYCKVADGGIATSADSGYRVIKRVSDNVVKVIFK